jgi:hypothetical protein
MLQGSRIRDKHRAGGGGLVVHRLVAIGDQSQQTMHKVISEKSIPCKKKVIDFPLPMAGMSLTKLSRAKNK